MAKREDGVPEFEPPLQIGKVDIFGNQRQFMEDLDQRINLNAGEINKIKPLIVADHEQLIDLEKRFYKLERAFGVVDLVGLQPDAKPIVKEIPVPIPMGLPKIKPEVKVEGKKKFRINRKVAIIIVIIVIVGYFYLASTMGWTCAFGR